MDHIALDLLIGEMEDEFDIRIPYEEGKALFYVD